MTKTKPGALGALVRYRRVLIIALQLLLGAVSNRAACALRFDRRMPQDKRVLIFGAGSAGELTVRDMKSDRASDYQPIGFVDDDEHKTGWRIHGVPVLGTRRDLPAIVERSRPDEILLAISNADPAVVRSVVRALEAFDIPIKTLPNLRDIIDRKVKVG